MVLEAMKLLIIAVMVKRTMVVKIALLTIKRICFSRLFLTQHAGDTMCEWRGHGMTCTKSVISLSLCHSTHTSWREGLYVSKAYLQVPSISVYCEE